MPAVDHQIIAGMSPDWLLAKLTPAEAGVGQQLTLADRRMNPSSTRRAHHTGLTSRCSIAHDWRSRYHFPGPSFASICPPRPLTHENVVCPKPNANTGVKQI